MIDEARTREIEQELRGTIQMQDDIICKLVALNERLKAALAIADYDSSECRYCQHRDDVDHCQHQCRGGSGWALDLDKLPTTRTLARGSEGVEE